MQIKKIVRLPMYCKKVSYETFAHTGKNNLLIKLNVLIIQAPSQRKTPIFFFC